MLPEGLVAAAQFAARRRISRERVVRKITVGELPGVNIEGRWYVRVHPDEVNQTAPVVTVQDLPAQ